ncbi:MAG TPA: hypothetical protein VLU95_04840 [Candidatus Acidoferrum sp.]|nr:hypothetical protein [Candidatus Acidoferrum sp.]
MTKGKPWPVEDEKQLTSWYNSGGKDLQVLAFSFDGKYSENAIYQKLLNLGLIVKEEEETCGEHSSSSSSFASLKLPDELPSVEETLKTLAAALKALDDSRLKRNDILRLRGIISGAKIYKELVADYINYRALEAELLELRGKYEALAKKSQGT